jgi:PHP family Zn ribbon phosphoesterase
MGGLNDLRYAVEAGMAIGKAAKAVADAFPGYQGYYECDHCGKRYHVKDWEGRKVRCSCGKKLKFT